MIHPHQPSGDILISEIPEIEAKQLLGQARHASWRQFPAYADTAARAAGAKSVYVSAARNGEILAVTNVRIKKLPIISTGIAMIAHGPVILSPSKETAADICCALREYLTIQNGFTLRINPAVNIADENTQPFESDGPGDFKPVPGSGYQSYIIDLEPDLDRLRKNLNGKWRTDLRRGEKAVAEGQIKITRSHDRSDFLRFQPLLEELAAKKGFQAPQDANFFAAMVKHCDDSERVVVHLAWHQDQLVGGHIGAYSGDMAVYLLGATNDVGRDLRASFLLQWAAIEYARILGMRHYDLGGVDEQANPSVYRFKKRMGGTFYDGTAMFEARARWPKGQIVDIAETVYRKLRG